jgi:hypothetical protein
MNKAQKQMDLFRPSSLDEADKLLAMSFPHATITRKGVYLYESTLMDPFEYIYTIKPRPWPWTWMRAKYRVTCS